VCSPRLWSALRAALFSWAPTYRQCHLNSCAPVHCQSRLISWGLSDRQSCQSSLGSWALTSHWSLLSFNQCLLRPGSSIWADCPSLLLCPASSVWVDHLSL
ncbi:hypothetical protein LDENG_00258230, partial [Lucifuga dentata]